MKKQQLREITEQDRKRKEEYMSQQKDKVQSEQQDNLISKFFNRKQHQSYGIRAQQDIVQKYIGDNFLSVTQSTKNISSTKDKPNDFEAAAAARVVERKKKELEVKKAQDDQVMKKEMAKD